MASPSANINGALVTGYRNAGIGIDVDAKTSYENVDFIPPADSSDWAAIWILPAPVAVDSLGAQGQDEHLGVFQIDLNTLWGTSTHNLDAYADIVQSYFVAGRRLTYNGQDVLVRSCSPSMKRKVDTWCRLSMSVYWQAWVNRAAIT